MIFCLSLLWAVLPKSAVSEGYSVPQEVIYVSPAEDAQIWANYHQAAPKTLKRVTNFCSCVTFAESQTGFAGPVGAAKNWPINSIWPVVGGVVVTYESSLGHVAVIKAVIGNMLILDEANYVRCTHTTTRELPIDSPLIKGFWVSN